MTIFYGINGEECQEKSACAKVTTTRNGNIHHYVLFSKLGLKNIYTGSNWDNTHAQWKWKRVEEKPFKLYLRYLKSRQELFLRNSERLILC